MLILLSNRQSFAPEYTIFFDAIIKKQGCLRLLGASTLLMLASCATPNKAVKWTTPVITIDGNEVSYRGHFLAQSYTLLKAVVGSQKVRTLRISSPGGEVGGAIDTALWVYRNGIDVVVDGGCFSSCANYVFPAGREKHIVDGGLVGWHGTIEHRVYMQAQGIAISDDPKVVDMFEKLAVKEREFYEELGLNGFISWFGKLPPYETKGIYFLSKEDMEYFGLTGLHVRDDYSRTDLSATKGSIGLLAIDRSVTNPSDPKWMIQGHAQKLKK